MRQTRENDTSNPIAVRKLTAAELRESDVWLTISDSVWKSFDRENSARIRRRMEMYATGIQSGPAGTEYRVAAYRVAEIQGWFRELVKA